MTNLPIESCLKKTLSQGGDASELFYEHSHTTSLVFEDKKVEKVETGIDTGVGLRLFANNKTAYAYTNDLSQLEDISFSLSGAIPAKNFDKTIRLEKQKPHFLLPIHKEPESIPLQTKIDLVSKYEKMAWGLAPEIVQVSIRYGDKKRKIKIANSDGVFVEEDQTYILFAVTVTVSNGNEFFTGFDALSGVSGFELLSGEACENAITKACKRALLNLKAKRAVGGAFPVVISSQAGGTMVHEAIGHGLEADLSCQGMSIFEGKLGQQVASNLVNVVDDPTIIGNRGSYIFDDEGTRSERSLLIENGILKSYMYDKLMAQKMGQRPNGHGRRESYRHRPIVRMSNTLLLPGKDNPDEIIQSVNNGLFVAMMGGGQVNTVNGDFMFEVTEGYEIKNGKLGDPVRGATLTGSALDVLSKIDKVGNDIGYSTGTCGKDGQGVPVSDGMPTVRISEMIVGGETKTI